MFQRLNKLEWVLWLTSLIVVTSSFLLTKDFNWLTLITSLVGVTALIFVSKGEVSGQVLTVVFSLLYAVISYQYRYFGEMITYVGMTMPIAIMSVVSWLNHPYRDTAEVEVNRLSPKQSFSLVFLTIITTILFYFLLKYFNTNNLIISTVSIATSFSASYLMLFRSPWYALAYAANDIVLITLWILATIQEISFLPMIFCFVMFFVNDVYGFVNWRHMQKQQEG